MNDQHPVKVEAWTQSSAPSVPTVLIVVNELTFLKASTTVNAVRRELKASSASIVLNILTSEIQNVLALLLRRLHCCLETVMGAYLTFCRVAKDSM